LDGARSPASDDVDRIRPASRARLRVGELIRSRFRVTVAAVPPPACGARSPIEASSARASRDPNASSARHLELPFRCRQAHRDPIQVDARPRGLVASMSLHMSTIAIPLRAHCGETARDRARARRALPRRTPHQLPTRPAVVETLPGGSLLDRARSPASDDVDRIRPASRARLRVGELIRSRFRVTVAAVPPPACGARTPIEASSARASRDPNASSARHLDCNAGAGKTRSQSTLGATRPRGLCSISRVVNPETCGLRCENRACPRGQMGGVRDEHAVRYSDSK
jgi:hypothetical protein